MEDNQTAAPNDEEFDTAGQQQLVVDAMNSEATAAILDDLPLSDALSELLNLSAEDRDAVLSSVPPELATRLIEEAPKSTATELFERLSAARAALC